MTIQLLASSAAALLGAVVGSFLNVIADRVPRGESIIAPASHCDACGRRLSPLEMIPLLSYLWLHGRCRTCAAPIGRRVPLLEVTAAVLGVLSVRLFGPTFLALLGAIFLWLFLVLSVIDIERCIVPRSIVIGGLVLALAVSPVWLVTGLPGAILGGLVSGLPYALLYVIAGRIYGRGKGLGLGDVWAATLMGVVTGFPWVVLALLTAAISAAVTAIALLASGRMTRRNELPTVPFFGLGTLVGILAGAGFALNFLVP
jgi:leader peptidase (prepilin peptidase) / N-methyltransferase